MTFGEALEQAKQGKKIERAGWNGKGMWVARQQPGVDPRWRRAKAAIIRRRSKTKSPPMASAA